MPRIIIIAIFQLSGLFPALLSQVTLNQTLEHDGQVREYIVYVPESYDPEVPTPLMFNFHGFTGQASFHLSGTGMTSVADTAGFILVAPQGSLFLGSTHWNVGAWTNGSQADDLGFTEAMIDRLIAQYNVDQTRIYSCGYSNGGYFSFELACQLSDRIAAVGSVGGKMSSETFEACDPQHPIPVVTIHGTSDFIVSYLGSQPAGSKSIPEVHAYWREYNMLDDLPEKENLPDLDLNDNSHVERWTWQSEASCATIEHYRINGGGHDWPGAWGNRDINSSELIWNFVSKHSLPALLDCHTITSAPHSAKAQYRLYPNPVDEYLFIEGNNESPNEIEIFNAMGTRMALPRKIREAGSIDVRHLPSGWYVLRADGTTIRWIKN